MTKQYKDQYLTLLDRFFEKTKDMELAGIPAPHIPSVGDLYSKAKYKIAFFGMETKGWGDLSDLYSEFQKDPDKAFDYLTEDFKELEFVNWTNNFGTSFFNYVLLFLSKFYHIKDWKSLRTDEKYQYLLKTFIWGNTNSIERYEVSAKQNGVNFDSWNKVKEESRSFDSAKYVLETCRPDILLVLNWSESENWLGNPVAFHKDEIADHLFHVYLEASGTHVYWLAHPRWLAINVGFEKSIETIIEDINRRSIHLDRVAIDEIQLKEESDRSEDKKEYIGQLAQFLSKRNIKMSGYELALNLNRNGFRTSYGTEYVGTRGTYKLIRDCYSHFHNSGKKDLATDIASAFVKENGNFAYE